MALREAVLWLHVLCGVTWVGTSAAFVLAASSMAVETEEWKEFALHAAPRINRINLVAAAIIPLSGIGNLFGAAMTRKGPFPPAFVGILSLKVVIYFVMAILLSAAVGAERRMREAAISAERLKPAAQRLTRLYGVIAGCGVVALGLGLWLAGT
jgi:uncharacterized membrane protein